MGEYLPRTALTAEGYQRGHDGEGYGRHRQELEEPGIYRRYEITHCVDGRHTQQAEDDANEERTQPPHQLFILIFHSEMGFMPSP